MIDTTSPAGSYELYFDRAETIDARKPRAQAYTATDAARTLAIAGHDKRRAPIRARAEEMRANLRQAGRLI